MNFRSEAPEFQVNPKMQSPRCPRPPAAWLKLRVVNAADGFRLSKRQVLPFIVCFTSIPSAWDTHVLLTTLTSYKGEL